MRLYRIKHVPTGLYYQPFKGGSHLSVKGKIYMTNSNVVSYETGHSTIRVRCNEDGKIHKVTKDFIPWEKRTYSYGLIADIPKSDFIEEEIK